MTSPTTKEFSTAQAQAALAGFALAQARPFTVVAYNVENLFDLDGTIYLGDELLPGAHALVTGRPLILGGVTIPHTHGLLGHSDADVVCHVLCEALLGAANMRNIGFHFCLHNWKLLLWRSR